MIALDKSGRLMTVAELMAATGLGQTSVCKALNELETEVKVDTQKDAKKTSVFDNDDITETESNAITEDAPVTKIVATILRHAAEGRAKIPSPNRNAFRHKLFCIRRRSPRPTLCGMRA